MWLAVIPSIRLRGFTRHATNTVVQLPVNTQAAAMKTQTSHGFTLPELLFVMVIAGILSIGALQGWQRWQQRQQLRDTAQQLQGFLQRLRAQANWHNRDLILWSRTETPWCIGSGPRPTEKCTEGKRLHFVTPNSQVKLFGIRGEPGFYGCRNMAKAGSIEIGNEAGRLRLIISARARIRVCQPDERGCE